jgi:hypothetical protein
MWRERREKEQKKLTTSTVVTASINVPCILANGVNILIARIGRNRT